MIKQFHDVSSQYGAPLGRREAHPGNAMYSDSRARLFRVRLNSGGYDEGGAYWGTGCPLFCLRIEDEGDLFVRARTRREAWEYFVRRAPDVRLIRGV